MPYFLLPDADSLAGVEDQVGRLGERELAQVNNQVAPHRFIEFDLEVSADELGTLPVDAWDLLLGLF